LSDGTPVIVIIAGAAVAKGRPRMTRQGFPYTPAKTRKYESHARLAAQLAMNGRPPIAGPVRAEVIIDLPVPTSWSRKRQTAALAASIRPTSRPDTDESARHRQLCESRARRDQRHRRHRRLPGRRARRGEEIRARPAAQDRGHSAAGNSGSSQKECADRRWRGLGPAGASAVMRTTDEDACTTAGRAWHQAPEHGAWPPLYDVPALFA